jgi:hypothetical protein
MRLNLSVAGGRLPAVGQEAPSVRAPTVQRFSRDQIPNSEPARRGLTRWNRLRHRLGTLPQTGMSAVQEQSAGPVSPAESNPVKPSPTKNPIESHRIKPNQSAQSRCGRCFDTAALRGNTDLNGFGPKWTSSYFDQLRLKTAPGSAKVCPAGSSHVQSRQANPTKSQGESKRIKVDQASRKCAVPLRLAGSLGRFLERAGGNSGQFE